MQPEKVKYRKMHRGSRTGLATSGNTVAFGEYGLMALERCWMDGKQLEACRVAITRYMKRKGKMWIRVFPQKSYTKKPLETRMARAKRRSKAGWPWFARRTFCLKWTASPRRKRANPCASLRRNCRSKPSLFRAITAQVNPMKFAEIKDMTLVELAAKGRDLRHEMFNLRLQQASAQLEKPARLRTLRKDIARVETRISALGNQAKKPAAKTAAK